MASRNRAPRPDAGSRATSSPKSRASRAEQYSDPELRERLKARILAGERGGRAGQWSARKAQLLAAEYARQGGRYAAPKSAAQRSLERWTAEQWTTADGAPARRGRTTARYLPEKAWSELTPAERRATDRKKRAASKTGRQFVANTGKAKTARRRATGAR